MIIIARGSPIAACLIGRELAQPSASHVLLIASTDDVGSSSSSMQCFAKIVRSMLISRLAGAIEHRVTLLSSAHDGPLLDLVARTAISSASHDHQVFMRAARAIAPARDRFARELDRRAR